MTVIIRFVLSAKGVLNLWRFTMPRIVKKDAQAYIPMSCLSEVFNKSDTIKIKKGWRPGGYKNLYGEGEYGVFDRFSDAREAFEAGFDACIEAEGKE